MARKGSRKVRTGCLTCKIRKIKCDEGKPFCNRCTSTGRKCDGYAVEPASVLRWQRPQTLQIDSSTSGEEARALQYYCEHVAPFIAGPTDPYFWTHLVVQFINREPAVKHSVIAIGLLYGNMNGGTNTHLDGVALSHYNAAIFELKSLQNDNNGLALVVCLLFVCIELLQSNTEAAVRHCNHGLAMLESSCSKPVVRDHLLPIFRRLNMLPSFPGTSYFNNTGATICRCPVPASFDSFAHAQATIDDLYNQTIQLIRLGDEYRVGALRHQTPLRELLERQRGIQSSLNQWRGLWEDLDVRSKSPSTRIRGGPRVHALLKYELSHVWTDMAFSANEAGFDQHLERFRQITEQTTKFAESQVNCQPTHFLFEAGYTPSLFFIATKCRALDVRLEALRLLSTLGSPREAVWDKGELFCIARRLIELEHNVGLDSFGVLQYTGPESCLGIPRDEVRIRHFVPEKSTLWDSSINGVDMGGNFKVRFFMRTPEDALYVHEEVLGCEYVPDLSPFEGQHESFSSSPQSIQGWEETTIF
ncbi:C6 zinc finger domain protein [Colletotrichum chrysophilum]|uniref:C6 zinc finger domain protein n=1 Tax=Colletotrichum chrysophilum TaxID=1836956 RepID=A0AAD9AFL7_9PEZI|nr:C6 zinc finger domain protein [Colletotrichum chrysophilum]